MDFALDQEHLELRKTLRAFFKKEAPTALVRDFDRSETFPVDLYQKMADLGLCGVTISEEYGGAPLDQLGICIVMEEIARAAGSLLYAFAPTVTFCAVGIERFGTEKQRRELLPKIASGAMHIAMGLSEPDAGSDLASLSTKAELVGDAYVINGQKIWTTGADSAEYIMAFVRTDAGSKGHNGLSVILIDSRAAGVTIRKIPKLAGQATHTCEVFFDDVRVPAENLLGSVGSGTKMIFELLDGERIYVGAQACGIAQGAFEQALSYSKQRQQFGKLIIEHQAIGHMLAEIAIEIEAARLITWRAAWKLDNKLPCSMEASMTKIAASEAATRCIAKAMQVMGGYSYSTEFPLERYWRETKLYEIAGGTNQIQRNIVAKHLKSLQDVDYY
jgi:alkylation response protein AidB-like acyl-CoA dehydrogenase